MQSATNTTIAGALSVAYSKYYFAYIGSDQRLYLYIGAQDAGFLPTDRRQADTMSARRLV